MSNGGGTQTRIHIFILVLNLIFPVLGYTFTTFGTGSERYELALDQDSLMIIGLNLVDGESHTFTWEGTWNEYVLLNTTIRARWYETLGGFLQPKIDAIHFQKQSALSKAFDGWFAAYTVTIKSLASNEWFNVLENATILRDYDTEFNWSRFVLKDGHHVFITPFADDGNMSKAIYEDGTLNVTIAKSFEESGERFNFWRFVGWYGSLMIGDQSWGLPSVFSWILRIIGALSVYAMVMLTRELIGFT